MQGLDPVANGQTTAEEIERCQADPEARLKLSPQAVPPQFVKHKGPRYTPIAKRQDKPDAIMYLLRSHPELSEAPDLEADRHDQADDRGGARPHPLEQPEHQAAPPRRARAVHAARSSTRRSPAPARQAAPVESGPPAARKRAGRAVAKYPLALRESGLRGAEA